MKLWLLTQDEDNGMDYYESMVVAAETEDDARRILPGITWPEEKDQRRVENDYWNNTLSRKVGWATKPENVVVKLLGIAEPEIKRGVIIESYIGDLL